MPANMLEAVNALLSQHTVWQTMILYVLGMLGQILLLFCLYMLGCPKEHTNLS